MIVIGSGAIGLELAQLFSRFGVKVTLLEGLPRIAPAEEPEIGEALARYLGEERMTLHAGVKIHKVGKSNGEYEVECEFDGRRETVAAEQLLVATGRRPNTAGLGFEAAGIATGRKGEIVVDETLRTANEDVYAAGDCIGDPMFVYVSAHGGGLAAENALTGAGRIFDLFALPRVTFTDPQIASVGHTEAQAREAGIEVKTATLSLEDVPRALAARDTRGLIKLVAEAETDRLVGAHVLAAEAGEIIQEATLAIRFGLKIADIVGTFHPYLTMAEGLKLAALTFDKEVAKLSCCAT
jgi:mercuric reductase